MALERGSLRVEQVTAHGRDTDIQRLPGHERYVAVDVAVERVFHTGIRQVRVRRAAERFDEGDGRLDRVGLATRLEMLGPDSKRDLVAGLGTACIDFGAHHRAGFQAY